MVIAAYYNGGGNAATAVLKGTTPATETRKYIQRIDKWLTEDFGKYANKPAKHGNKLMKIFGIATFR